MMRFLLRSWWGEPARLSRSGAKRRGESRLKRPLDTSRTCIIISYLVGCHKKVLIPTRKRRLHFVDFFVGSVYKQVKKKNFIVCLLFFFLNFCWKDFFFFLFNKCFRFTCKDILPAAKGTTPPI